MKFFIHLFSAFFICFTFFLGCSNTAKEVVVVEDDKPWKDVAKKDNNALLWKIEGNGAVPSYIYGTMHLIEKEYYKMTVPMVNRITNSDAIIMEVGGMPDPVTAYNMMTLDSGTVHDYFTKEEMAQLLEYMDTELGITPEVFHKKFGPMKPFFILQNLASANFEGETESYDLTIMQLAGENNIPLIGFETVEEQLGFFDVISQEQMVRMILESIGDTGEQKKETKKLMKLYSKEKVDELIPLMNKQSPEFMEFSDLFLYDRNKAWIPKIKEEVADKQCFIAVGAAHLFGDRGVIELLKKEGYTLTPISVDN